MSENPEHGTLGRMISSVKRLLRVENEQDREECLAEAEALSAGLGGQAYHKIEKLGANVEYVAWKVAPRGVMAATSSMADGGAVVDADEAVLVMKQFKKRIDFDDANMRHHPHEVMEVRGSGMEIYAGYVNNNK